MSVLVGSLAGQSKPTAPLDEGEARGTVTAGTSKISYTNAYAILIARSNTLIVGCLDTPVWPAEIEKVVAFARRETTAVFKVGLDTTSASIFEIAMPFKAGTSVASVAALEGFRLTISNKPIEWTFAPNAPTLKNTAGVVELSGALKAGARVRGRIVGNARDTGRTPPSPLSWDVAFDAVVAVAQ